MSLNVARQVTRPTGVVEDLDLSVVIPVFNEEQNIEPLCGRVITVLDELSSLRSELIFVNDGSSDGSEAVLQALAAREFRVKIINLARNAGQTAALMAGFKHARGAVIVVLDGDMQNDPRDIPSLLAKMNEGYNVVSGLRERRKDKFLTRRLPSIVANRIISVVSGVRLHDYGCSLKAYRRDIIKPVRLYGEMHRFIPIYAAWQGARIAEIPVRHHARTAGRSKYGLSRIFKVALDLCVVTFLDRFATKPIYVFGAFGLFGMAVGVLCLLMAVYWRIVDNISLIQTPMPLLAVMTFTLGLVSILMGLLAELIMRTWFESQNKTVYLLKNFVNFE